MLQGCIKALQVLPQETLISIFMPIIRNIWTGLLILLDAKKQDKEIIEHICSLINKILKNLSSELVTEFPSLAKILIHSFQMNHENYECIRLFAYGIGLLK